MEYNFDEEINRRGTDSVKWDAGEMIKKFGITERFDEDTIPLWVADMDFAIPEPVLDALRKRLDQKMFGYTIQRHLYCLARLQRLWIKPGRGT